MLLSGYMNAPTEPEFLALRHGMEYHMCHPHEHIMYSRNNIFKANEIPLKCFFKSGKAEINQTQQYSKLIHSYCGADHARDITVRRSVTSTSHLSNGAIIDWCSKKQTKTFQSSFNPETIAIYKGMVDQDCIRNFCGSIGYTIGNP